MTPTIGRIVHFHARFDDFSRDERVIGHGVPFAAAMVTNVLQGEDGQILCDLHVFRNSPAGPVFLDAVPFAGKAEDCDFASLPKRVCCWPPRVEEVVRDRIDVASQAVKDDRAEQLEQPGDLAQAAGDNEGPDSRADGGPA